MNKPNDWQTTVTIHDPQRAAFWQNAIGTNRLPIRSIIPQLANLPGLPNAAVYLLDTAAISDEMKHAIANAIVQKFGAPSPQVVLEDMASNGMPILADGCSVTSSDPIVLSLII